MSRNNDNLEGEFYNLDDVIKILEKYGNSKVLDSSKIKNSVIDKFLFSGKFNSVLGLDGFKIFKDKIKDVIKNVNDDNFGLNYINLDQMAEALLDSGIYYLDEYIGDDLSELKNDDSWLTVYRYIAKNFPDIKYKDFREIVKRFKDSRGYSVYVKKGDSRLLREIGESPLFEEVIDLKSELMHMNQKEQRQLCEKLGVKSARSLEKTANRIIEEAEEKALDIVLSTNNDKKSYLIKDLELATGNDIINLDKYIRSLAKVVRYDLATFIAGQRHGTLLG